MADNNSGSTNLVVLTPQNAPDFTKDRIKLQKLLKTLDKASKEAVEVLIKIMNSTEDEKLKADCAKQIVNFYIAIAEKVNADAMQRMVAEARLGNGSKNLIPIGQAPADGKPNRPVVNFNEIRDVN